MTNSGALCRMHVMRRWWLIGLEDQTDKHTNIVITYRAFSLRGRDLIIEMY